MKNFLFWLENARIYSLPITILNWFVIFIYSIKENGNIFAGLLALVGVSFAHMATNLIDDYFDYKILIKNEEYMNSAQNCKCAYLRTGKTSVKELQTAIIIFLAIASPCPLSSAPISGCYVALLALAGLIIALTYQKFSTAGLGEIAVILAYGPLLYEGIYYVMTSRFSYEVLILSIACALFTNTILYAHMLMDYDGDECSHKITLCRKFKNKDNALRFILVFYTLSFIFVSIYACISNNIFLYLTFITIPLIADLYRCLKLYNQDKTQLPKIYPWHYPLDSWNKIKNTPEASFYFRFYYSRNIVTFFMLLTCIALILK